MNNNWREELKSLPYAQNGIVCSSCKDQDFVCRTCIANFIFKEKAQSRQQGRMEMAEEIEKALPKPLEKYRGFPLEVDEKAVNETLRRVSTIINNLKVK